MLLTIGDLTLREADITGLQRMSMKETRILFGDSESIDVNIPYETAIIMWRAAHAKANRKPRKAVKPR